MKRVICMLLAVGMLLSFSACGKKDEEETKPKDDAVTFTEDDDWTIPDDLKFSGTAPVRILTWDADKNEFPTEEDSRADNLSEALYKRELSVGSRLDVTFEHQTEKGGYGNPDLYGSCDYVEFVNKIENAVMSGLSEWDIVSSYSFAPALMLQRGLINDLRPSEYIDFDKEWWPKFLMDECTVNGKTFFITGDVSVNILLQMDLIMFNRANLNSHGISDEVLYAQVLNGDWTVEQMFQYSKGIYQDSNLDGIVNSGDDYGVCILDYNLIDAFYFASAGMKVYDRSLQQNGKVTLTPSEDLTSQKITDMFDYFKTKLFTTKELGKDSGFGTALNGRYMFYGCASQQLTVISQEADYKFGVLPFPKWEKTDNPTEYRTLIANRASYFSIPITCADSSRAEAVLEVMARYSYENVTPVVFEKMLKLRYSQSSDDAAMFDIIRSGMTTELAILFASIYSHGKAPNSYFRDSVTAKDSITSYYKSNFEAEVKKAATDIISAFEK